VERVQIDKTEVMTNVAFIIYESLKKVLSQQYLIKRK